MGLSAREKQVLEAGMERIKGGTMPVQVICADDETLKEVQAFLKGKKGLKQVTPVLNKEPNLPCFGSKVKG